MRPRWELLIILIIGIWALAINLGPAFSAQV